MENLSKRFAGPAGARDRVSVFREDHRTVLGAQDDLDLAKSGRLNLLLMGRDDLVEQVVDDLAPDLPAPVERWKAAARPAAPLPQRVGTIVIRHVDAMTMEDQRDLMAWLESAGARTQVVSTTAVPLLARVRQGEFLDDLYYRLNTVFVDLTE
jgi:phosphoserine phosphatase